MARHDREEYIEQAYFFRVLRERLGEGIATQDALESIDQEILSTTRLPMAVQFLATEIKHSGQLSSGFTRLSHYFSAYQAYIVAGSETDARRFSTELALLVLEREAEYRAKEVTVQGLFVYQFEVISRNRLGYEDGLRAMSKDDFYPQEWKDFFDMIRSRLGVVEFAELVYARSDLYVADKRRDDPDYEPPVPPLFGEKEGKIAKANIGRDPLYLFAALHRQLGYPEVPRPASKDDAKVKLETVILKFRDLEMRMKLLEAEVRGTLDLSKLADPTKLTEPTDEAW